MTSAVEAAKAGVFSPWGAEILADQLNLSQPRGGGLDYAQQIFQAPPDFQTFLRP